MKTAIRFLTIGACLTLAGTTWGALNTYYFRAAPVTKTMGDGANVVMWGFAQDSGPAVDDGVVTVPGPKIELPPGNQDVTIVLENRLPEPVSIIIPGLGAALGDPQRNPDGRARSLTHEAAPGGTATYIWNNVTPGTYLYHSGSHPSVQVQMGLYGALTKLQANSRAYQGVDTHNSEVTLLFSEIDPVLHEAVATGNYGLDDVDNAPLGWSTGGTKGAEDVDYNNNGVFDTKAVHSTSSYRARHFLINGQSFTNGFQTNGLAHIAAGNIPNNNAEQRVLLRLLSASLDSHVPVLNGEYLKLIAEDGKPYENARNLNAAQLPALKTFDAFWTARQAGTFPLYDRRLDLVNNTASPGGMLTYLAVSKTLNGGAITIPLNGSGTPYPSTINVSGLQGVVSKVAVRLNGFYHERPSDVDVLLVSPAGPKVLLMSDVGDSFVIPSTSPVTLTFDDAATASLTAAQLVTGTYKPTNLAGAPDTFPSPAPGAPYEAVLSAFNNTSPNGAWRLFVRDNLAGGGTTTGRIASWNLIITPRPQ